MVASHCFAVHAGAQSNAWARRKLASGSGPSRSTRRFGRRMTAISRPPANRRRLPKRVQVVGPLLHHPPSFIETLSAVVGSANFVSLDVCELALYQVGGPAALVQ